MSKYKSNSIVMGNLNFYLGNIYLDIDKATAKEYFLKAKELFKQVFKSDHDVFGVIDEVLETL